jgi:hypothetical protein
MKNLFITFIVSGLFLFAGCNKDEQSERFKLLTGPVWGTDSLLANGVDASGPGMVLAKFKGEAKFNTNGSGHFGVYPGTWFFSADETKIIIKSDSIPIALTTIIRELTNTSLKITTAYPNQANPGEGPINIRMTFKAK